MKVAVKGAVNYGWQEESWGKAGELLLIGVPGRLTRMRFSHRAENGPGATLVLEIRAQRAKVEDCGGTWHEDPDMALRTVAHCAPLNAPLLPGCVNATPV